MIKRNTGATLGVVAALALLLAACGDAVGPNPTDVEFASSLGIDLELMTQTASGLYIRNDSIGAGVAAAPGDQVTVSFTGWLADGTQFDSGEFSLTIGVTNLVAGFTEGVTGMRVDGIRTIVVPAALGYGSNGLEDADIPGGAVLVFEITVISIVKPQG